MKWQCSRVAWMGLVISIAWRGVQGSESCESLMETVETNAAWEAARTALLHSINFTVPKSEGGSGNPTVSGMVSFDPAIEAAAQKTCTANGFDWTSDATISLSWRSSAVNYTIVATGSMGTCLPKGICSCSGEWGWELPQDLRGALHSACLSQNETILCAQQGSVDVDVSTVAHCTKPSTKPGPPTWWSEARGWVIVASVSVGVLVAVVLAIGYIMRSPSSRTRSTPRPSTDTDWRLLLEVGTNFLQHGDEEDYIPIE